MLFQKKKSFTSRIFGSEMQKSFYFFLRKMCLLCSFYQIKVQAISYWSSRLRKHQTLVICLLSAFVRTSQVKNRNFRGFSEIFENRP